MRLASPKTPSSSDYGVFFRHMNRYRLAPYSSVDLVIELGLYESSCFN